MLGKRLAIGCDCLAADNFLDLSALCQIVCLPRLFDVFGKNLLLIFGGHAVERAVSGQNAASGIAGIQHLPVFRITHHILDLVDDDRVDVAILVPDLIIGIVRRDELIDAQNIVGHVLLFAADRRILLELIFEFLNFAACRAEQPRRDAFVFQPKVRRCKVQGSTAV